MVKLFANSEKQCRSYSRMLDGFPSDTIMKLRVHSPYFNGTIKYYGIVIEPFSEKNTDQYLIKIITEFDADTGKVLDFLDIYVADCFIVFDGYVFGPGGTSDLSIIPIPRQTMEILGKVTKYPIVFDSENLRYVLLNYEAPPKFIGTVGPQDRSVDQYEDLTYGRGSIWKWHDIIVKSDIGHRLYHVDDIMCGSTDLTIVLTEPYDVLDPEAMDGEFIGNDSIRVVSDKKYNIFNRHNLDWDGFAQRYLTSVPNYIAVIDACTETTRVAVGKDFSKVDKSAIRTTCFNIIRNIRKDKMTDAVEITKYVKDVFGTFRLVDAESFGNVSNSVVFILLPHNTMRIDIK